MKKIIVVGSSNTDMVVKSSHLPGPGETVLGGNFLMTQGGKGANQAVAVKRMGGNLIFVARLGNDLFGDQTIEVLAKEGICTEYITRDKMHPSGVALINVDEKAENTIVVASGANLLLDESDIDKIEGEMSEGGILLMQLESPIATVVYAAKKAFEKGMKVILNPAPAQHLPESLYNYLYMITPNRIEAEMLTGIKINNDSDIALAAEKLSKKGVKNVIITLGSKGCFVREGNNSYSVDSFKVKAVDSTAAGDTFNGALCVGIAENMELKQAVKMASQASSIAVTRMGAQSSIPHRSELV